MNIIEEWWKNVCIDHNCKYYIHEDYPKYSYCTCPNNCILTDKSKAESEEIEQKSIEEWMAGEEKRWESEEV